MPEAWWEAFRKTAEPHVEQFVRDHPGYAIDSDQSDYRGGTNLITFARGGGDPVVIKYFVNPARWVNELACLRHFAPTRTVPAVLDVQPDRIIVLPRLGGADIGAALRTMDRALVPRLSEEVGHAVGRLVAMPLPASDERYNPARDFAVVPWRGDTRRVVELVLDRSWGIVRAVAAYADPVFAESLRLLESQLDAIPTHRRVLFHEDISNLRVTGDGRFVAFYDLEMCRLGTEPLQLAFAAGLCAGESGLSWDHLRRGYAAATGRTVGTDDAVTIAAMALLYPWIRACHWGDWSGDARQARFLAEAPANAAWIHAHIVGTCRFHLAGAELRRWCPSPSVASTPE